MRLLLFSLKRGDLVCCVVNGLSLWLLSSEGR